MRKISITLCLLLVSIVCSAQTYVFDFPFRSIITDNGFKLEDTRSDINNAYRVCWNIDNVNAITVTISEVTIDSNGNAYTVKEIENINLTPSNLTLFDEADRFSISSNSIAYFMMFEGGCIRVKGMKGYTFTIPSPTTGMILYTKEDGKKYETRILDYYNKTYDNLRVKLRTLTWGAIR